MHFAAYAVEGQVKEKSRWFSSLKALSEKFKVLEFILCCSRFFFIIISFSAKLSVKKSKHQRCIYFSLGFEKHRF